MNTSNLSLYVHWPFCVAKCPYCDFNSHVRASVDDDRWERSFLKELLRLFEITGPRPLYSIFFGGGTPSLMRPSTVEAILKKAKELWGFDENIEITLEANPQSVEIAKFQALKAAGINRVSLGIQALNDPDLKALGRKHDLKEAYLAIETAQKTFDRVSLDFIYARPQQTLADWQDELSQILSFGMDHLSLYQLTIEAGTAFATQHARGELVLPNDDVAAQFYEKTRTQVADKGLINYEVSNYAKPGQESRHNLVYWSYGDYMGVGPGAHGRLTIGNDKVATQQYKLPERWLLTAAEGSGDESLTSLTLHEQTTEQLMMGLRLNRPFDLSLLPLQWESILNKSNLLALAKEGYLIQENNFLSLTPKGQLCLNAILGMII